MAARARTSNKKQAPRSTAGSVPTSSKKPPKSPFSRFARARQLFVNTATTIVTFLMVFLMQATQNRDTEALQLKIDELIRAIDTADDGVIGLDKAEDETLEAAREKSDTLASLKIGPAT